MKLIVSPQSPGSKQLRPDTALRQLWGADTWFWRHVTRGYWALLHTWLAAPWDVGSCEMIWFWVWLKSCRVTVHYVTINIPSKQWKAAVRAEHWLIFPAASQARPRHVISTATHIHPWSFCVLWFQERSDMILALHRSYQHITTH